MKRLSAVLMVGVMVLVLVPAAFAALGVTLNTGDYPLNISQDGTPCAVYVTFIGLTQDTVYAYKVRFYTDSKYSGYIWDNNSKQWNKSTAQWKNQPSFTATSASEEMWVFVKNDTLSAGDVKFSINLRKLSGDPVTTNLDSSITLLDMTSETGNGSWVYATATSSTAGKAVLAFNASNEIIGTYAIEDNGVTEGYTTTSGYFKIAVPANTSIPKLQARNADNSIFNTQESTKWTSGDPGVETDLDEIEDVSLPVTLTSFTATPGNAKVTLNWVTESEVENLGFNIYRNLYSDEQLSIINYQLIPGHGNTSSRHEYQYVDRNVINGIEYWYQLEDVSRAGETEKHNIVSAIPKGREELGMVPDDFQLFPCYPNPFNPTTNISFYIPENAHVTLRIIDLRGNLVKTLINGELQQNQYEVTWSGKDANDRIVGNGVYFYQLTTDKGFIRTEKMIFLR